MQVGSERNGVSRDIQMVNKLPVPMLAMRECTSVLWHKAVPGALGIDEQVGQWGDDNMSDRIDHAIV